MLTLPIARHTVKQSKTLTCQRKHCTPTTLDNHLHYVVYNVPVSDVPNHCPCCGQPTHTRDFDYIDDIASRYHRSRQYAAACIDTVNEYNQRHQSQPIGITKFFRMAGLTPTTSTGICPLHISCQSCGGTFVLVRTNPTANTLPTYCVWCGSSQTSIRQCNTNETADIVLNQQESFSSLANAYNISQPLIEALYDEWTSSSHLKFFAEYMQSEEVQLTLTQLQAISK